MLSTACFLCTVRQPILRAILPVVLARYFPPFTMLYNFGISFSFKTPKLSDVYGQNGYSMV